MSDPTLAVIVVTYNSAPTLPACLESVMKQHVAAEVAVVDNASSDGSADLASAVLPDSLVIRNQRNCGFAAAVNQGIRDTRAGYVMLLNPDAEVCPGTFSRLRDVLDGDRRVGAVGPRQWVDRSMTWQWSVIPADPRWSTLLRRAPLAWRWLPWWNQSTALQRSLWCEDRTREVPLLSGGSMMLRRQALAQIGGLDERYFLFFEDVDLCHRLRRAGWGLCAVPSAAVVHQAMGSRIPGFQRAEYLLNSGRRYLARHAGLVTRVLWELQHRWYVRSQSREVSPMTQRDPLTAELTWSGLPAAAQYCVEISSDPAFHFSAGAMVQRPIHTVPSSLLDAHGRGFCRITAHDTGCRVHAVSRPSALRGAWR